MAKVKNKIHDLFSLWFELFWITWIVTVIYQIRCIWNLSWFTLLIYIHWHFESASISWDMLDLLILLGVATTPGPRRNSCSEHWEYCWNWKFQNPFLSQMCLLCNSETGWSPVSQSCSLSSEPPVRRRFAFHVRELTPLYLPIAQRGACDPFPATCTSGWIRGCPSFRTSSSAMSFFKIKHIVKQFYLPFYPHRWYHLH